MKTIAKSARVNSACAFTMVELLVVIGIMVILAVLSLVVVSSARRKAWTASDIGNLHQIGIALQFYADEHNQCFPTSSVPIPGTKLAPDQPDRFVFPEAVDRYLPPPQGFFPGSAYNFLRRTGFWTSKFSRPYPGFATANRATYNGNDSPWAYGYNRFMEDPQWQGRISKIPDASRFVAIGEVSDSNALSPDRRPDFVSDKQSPYRISRPNRSALYLFCDYHVELLSGDLSESGLKSAGRRNIWRWW